MPCPNLTYIHTYAVDREQYSQTHARKRTRTQINARKLIVAIDAWAISVCKCDCALRFRSKTFRMYYIYMYYCTPLSAQVDPAGFMGVDSDPLRAGWRECCSREYCSTVLYCNVLYCTVMYCTVMYCTVMYCNVM